MNEESHHNPESNTAENQPEHRFESLGDALKAGKNDELSGLKAGLEGELSEGGYFKVLESRSLRLQTRVSPILKALCFQADPGAITLMEAIEHFKEKDGAVSSSAPLDFLEPQEREAVIGAEGERFRTSLYKAFLFIHTANAIKSGNLNLEQSIKHRSLDDYLSNKERWHRKKE